MWLQLDGLERHGELVPGRGRYSAEVRAELEAMSAVTIDRCLAAARAKDSLRGVAATKPSPLLRSSIQVRTSGDEVEDSPGFFEGDTVAHCGPRLRGEFVRTLNLTGMCTGWVFTRRFLPNGANLGTTSSYGLDSPRSVETAWRTPMSAAKASASVPRSAPIRTFRT